jgi:hypothetical protein
MSCWHYGIIMTFYTYKRTLLHLTFTCLASLVTCRLLGTGVLVGTRPTWGVGPTVSLLMGLNGANPALRLRHAFGKTNSSRARRNSRFLQRLTVTTYLT